MTRHPWPAWNGSSSSAISSIKPGTTSKNGFAPRLGAMGAQPNRLSIVQKIPGSPWIASSTTSKRALINPEHQQTCRQSEIPTRWSGLAADYSRQNCWASYEISKTTLAVDPGDWHDRLFWGAAILGESPRRGSERIQSRRREQSRRRSNWRMVIYVQKHAAL